MSARDYRFQAMHSARLVILSMALACAGCAAGDVGRPPAMPIAEARTQPMGSRVIVAGVVIVSPGALDPGFALQDDSGGIYVSRAPAAIELGATVRVDGTITAPDQRITIEPRSIAITGRIEAPAPVGVKTAAVGPRTEGRLIAVRGTVTGDIVDDRPWGYKMYVDDGSGPLLVFIAATTRIDVTRYRAGQDLRVTGFSGRFGTHTEILPRSQSDIAIASE
jgi:hypothetical protein